MKTIEYVVYRYGSNGANQPMTQSMPIGIYSGTGKTAQERMMDACGKAETEHTVYANQYLSATPAARVAADEKEGAWEYQLTHQPTEDFHQVGHIS